MTVAVGSTAWTTQFHSPPPEARPPLRRRGSQTEVQAPHMVGFGQTHPCRTQKPKTTSWGQKTHFGTFCIPTGRLSQGSICFFCGSYNWNPSSPCRASEYWEISRGLVGPCVTREVQDPGALRRSCFHFPGQAGQVWADILGGAAGQPPASPKILEDIQSCIISLSLLPLARADVVCKWNLTETTDVLLSRRREILPGGYHKCLGWVWKRETQPMELFHLHPTGTADSLTYNLGAVSSNCCSNRNGNERRNSPKSGAGSYQVRQSKWKINDF